MSDTVKRRKSVSEINQELEGIYSPSQFMRARRPELFSDSKNKSESQLNIEVLDYRLSVLTSKKQETDFEHFSRRIAEQEICPALVVQTGPTGGGDSKVDSENYPVSERISVRWYKGLPNNSGDERWAFAFSAKREWRSKVRADVEGISSTDRGYKHIYFITNQYVPDKSRSQVEDQLSGKYGAKVHIMDRSWLLKCVFEHGRQEIAIETLHLDAASTNSIHIGPRDLARAQNLEEIEARIGDTSRYSGAEYQLVEDCLSAAILSRNLERPRVETDGRFSRAERAAATVGFPQQRLRVAYYRAWTSYWWFEDYNEFLRSYNEVEPLALGSSIADDVQLAVNLWQLLFSACKAGFLTEEDSGLEARRERLDVVLSILAKDFERPNTALSARTSMALLDLLAISKDQTDPTPAISNLIKIASQTEGLLDYPVEPLSQIVEELGDYFVDVPLYDELIESLVDLTQRRMGKEQSGRMLLARGFQKLHKSRVYEAIRLFGRAQQKLAMREAREELTHALFAGSLAYEGAGLLWAARANALASTNLVYAELREGGPIPDNALLCARKLTWIELQLGRVAHVLQWAELAMVIAANRGMDTNEKGTFFAERESQDLALALLLLKADLVELMDLRFLPEILERLDLPFSRIALLYALGYEDFLRSEGSFPSGESDEEVLSIFTKFVKQAPNDDLPSGPTALGAGKLSFVSPVLGCRVIAIAESDYQSQRLAERILAGIEALFATSLDEEIFPYREELTITVHSDQSHQGVPRATDEASFGDSISVVHGGSIGDRVVSGQDWFLNILIVVLTRLVMMPEPEEYMKRIFGEESGLARSINFTESSIAMTNILGHKPKTRIPDWNCDEHPKPYIPKRVTPWHGSSFARRADTVLSELNAGTGEVPEELLDQENTKHTERRISAITNLPLWNKARWNGVLYKFSYDLDEEPWMGLSFGDEEASKLIFKQWREKFSSVDKDERIRISVITGVDRSNPHFYSVVVGSNLVEGNNGPPIKQFVSVSRVNRMMPSTSINLTTFISRFERIGSYRLMPAYLNSKTQKYIDFPELAILKRQIKIMPAWEIGENDIDGVGIFPEDSPIIPAGINDPPVLRLLNRKKTRTKNL